MASSVFVTVSRGTYVESTHAVALCVARADGDVLYATGDVDRAYPVRSLAKPMLAAEFVRCGAADAYSCEDIELSLAAGSHDGEERHIAAIRAFLDRVGLTEDVLDCGPAMEGKLVVGPPAGNNCSGKHTAVLAMCLHSSLSIDGYIERDHPIQRRLMPLLREKFGQANDRAETAVDGCGMPVFTASLRQIATTYARFGIANDAASVRVRDAMAAEPGYVGGWFGNLDTRIITWSEGAIIGKIGAEGLHADALVGLGIGIAVKVQDGNSRALAPVLAHLFRNFSDEIPLAKKHLAELEMPPVLSASGHRVGELRANGIAGFRNLLIADRR